MVTDMLFDCAGLSTARPEATPLEEMRNESGASGNRWSRQVASRLCD